MSAREQRGAILSAAVIQMLDYLERAYPDGELGVVAIVCEVDYENADGEGKTGVPVWCSDPRRFVQHGLLHTAAWEAIA
jgi:hypothetical protein